MKRIVASPRPNKKGALNGSLGRVVLIVAFKPWPLKYSIFSVWYPVITKWPTYKRHIVITYKITMCALAVIGGEVCLHESIFNTADGCDDKMFWSLPRSRFCLVTQYVKWLLTFEPHSFPIVFSTHGNDCNHLSAKWKWCQFSCREWPLWFNSLNQKCQVLFCFQKHWTKDWRFPWQKVKKQVTTNKHTWHWNGPPLTIQCLVY